MEKLGRSEEPIFRYIRLCHPDRSAAKWRDLLFDPFSIGVAPPLRALCAGWEFNHLAGNNGNAGVALARSHCVFMTGVAPPLRVLCAGWEFNRGEHGAQMLHYSQSSNDWRF